MEAAVVAPSQKRKRRHKNKQSTNSVPNDRYDINHKTKPQQRRPGKKKQRQLNYQKKHATSLAHRLWITAQSMLFTNSVQFMVRPSSSHQHAAQDAVNDDTQQQLQQQQPPPPPSVPKHFQVVTSTLTHPNLDSTTATTTIVVQPLLILDLNGILCHRIRNTDLPYTCYRQCTTKKIANTVIVPRPHLHEWLHVLDQHFMLAIWTSAKQSTATKLLQMLVPETIRNRLLFCHAQQQCVVAKNTKQKSKRTSPTHQRPQDILYQKDLQKIWQDYPVYNASNTLIMDDSPDKILPACPETCGIHPPPLDGRRMGCPDTKNVLDDTINVQAQQRFFDALIAFWKDHTTVVSWSGVESCRNGRLEYGKSGQGEFLAVHRHLLQGQ